MHDVLDPTGGPSGPSERGASARGAGIVDVALVDAAAEVAETVLRPAAEATDQAAIVPVTAIEALAAAGLMGLMGPADAGGHAAAAATNRRVFEILAGACGVSFFVWVQHHAPVRLLTRSENVALRQRWLPALCRGEVLGGIAFAYLRRPGPPAVMARPVPGGYRIDGEAPYVTSWGLAGMFSVAAALPAGDAPDAWDRAVYFCLGDPAREEVRPSAPLALVAMNASSTVRLGFSDLFVPHDDVITLIDLNEWHRRDAIATAQPNPAAFGIAASALDGIDAQALAEELDRCRSESYARADRKDDQRRSPEHLDRLVEARAWSLELAVRCATARVVARGGRAMSRSDPAQRLLREAAFFTIQAQTKALREATLQRLGRS